MPAMTHAQLVQEFIDAPHEASGPAPDDVTPHFEPPFFEWWDTRAATDPSSKHKVYGGWEESAAKLRQVMIEQGPFDGAMGFSQGGTLAACAAALQEASMLAPGEVPPLMFVVVLAGFPPRDPALAALFARPLSLPSLHIIGERDMLKRRSAQLQAHFTIHTDIWHKQGHVVPRLSGEELQVLRNFFKQFAAAKPRL